MAAGYDRDNYGLAGHDNYELSGYGNYDLPPLLCPDENKKVKKKVNFEDNPEVFYFDKVDWDSEEVDSSPHSKNKCNPQCDEQGKLPYKYGKVYGSWKRVRLYFDENRLYHIIFKNFENLSYLELVPMLTRNGRDYSSARELDHDRYKIGFKNKGDLMKTYKFLEKESRYEVLAAIFNVKQQNNRQPPWKNRSRYEKPQETKIIRGMTLEKALEIDKNYRFSPPKEIPKKVETPEDFGGLPYRRIGTLNGHEEANYRAQNTTNLDDGSHSLSGEVTSKTGAVNVPSHPRRRILRSKPQSYYCLLEKYTENGSFDKCFAVSYYDPPDSDSSSHIHCCYSRKADETNVSNSSGSNIDLCSSPRNSSKAYESYCTNTPDLDVSSHSLRSYSSKEYETNVSTSPASNIDLHSLPRNSRKAHETYCTNTSDSDVSSRALNCYSRKEDKTNVSNSSDSNIHLQSSPRNSMKARETNCTKTSDSDVSSQALSCYSSKPYETNVSNSSGANIHLSSTPRNSSESHDTYYTNTLDSDVSSHALTCYQRKAHESNVLDSSGSNIDLCSSPRNSSKAYETYCTNTPDLEVSSHSLRSYSSKENETNVSTSPASNIDLRSLPRNSRKARETYCTNTSDSDVSSRALSCYSKKEDKTNVSNSSDSNIHLQSSPRNSMKARETNCTKTSDSDVSSRALSCNSSKICETNVPNSSGSTVNLCSLPRNSNKALETYCRSTSDSEFSYPKRRGNSVFDPYNCGLARYIRSRSTTSDSDVSSDTLGSDKHKIKSGSHHYLSTSFRDTPNSGYLQKTTSHVSSRILTRGNCRGRYSHRLPSFPSQSSVSSSTSSSIYARSSSSDLNTNSMSSDLVGSSDNTLITCSQVIPDLIKSSSDISSASREDRDSSSAGFSSSEIFSDEADYPEERSAEQFTSPRRTELVENASSNIRPEECSYRPESPPHLISIFDIYADMLKKIALEHLQCDHSE